LWIGPRPAGIVNRLKVATDGDSREPIANDSSRSKELWLVAGLKGWCSSHLLLPLLPVSSYGHPISSGCCPWPALHEVEIQSSALPRRERYHNLPHTYIVRGSRGPTSRQSVLGKGNIYMTKMNENSQMLDPRQTCRIGPIDEGADREESLFDVSIVVGFFDDTGEVPSTVKRLGSVLGETGLLLWTRRGLGAVRFQHQVKVGLDGLLNFALEDLPTQFKKRNGKRTFGEVTIILWFTGCFDLTQIDVHHVCLNDQVPRYGSTSKVPRCKNLCSSEIHWFTRTTGTTTTMGRSGIFGTAGLHFCAALRKNK
jgi:hypothetical protein